MGRRFLFMAVAIASAGCASLDHAQPPPAPPLCQQQTCVQVLRVAHTPLDDTAVTLGVLAPDGTRLRQVSIVGPGLSCGQGRLAQVVRVDGVATWHGPVIVAGERQVAVMFERGPLVPPADVALDLETGQGAGHCLRVPLRLEVPHAP